MRQAKNEKNLALMLDDAVTLQSEERGSASSRAAVVAKLKTGYSGYGDVSTSHSSAAA
jgi:hypothetical protein